MTGPETPSDKKEDGHPLGEPLAQAVTVSAEIASHRDIPIALRKDEAGTAIPFFLTEEVLVDRVIAAIVAPCRQRA